MYVHVACAHAHALARVRVQAIDRKRALEREREWHCVDHILSVCGLCSCSGIRGAFLHTVMVARCSTLNVIINKISSLSRDNRT